MPLNYLYLHLYFYMSTSKAFVFVYKCKLVKLAFSRLFKKIQHIPSFQVKLFKIKTGTENIFRTIFSFQNFLKCIWKFIPSLKISLIFQANATLIKMQISFSQKLFFNIFKIKLFVILLHFKQKDEIIRQESNKIWISVVTL